MKSKFLLILAISLSSISVTNAAIIMATSATGGSTTGAFPTLIDSETNPTIQVFGPLASTGLGNARAIRFFLDQRNGTFPEFFISGGPLDFANTFVNGAPAVDPGGNGRADLAGQLVIGTNTILTSALPDTNSTGADSGMPGDLQLAELTFNVIDTNNDGLLDFNDISDGMGGFIEADQIFLTSARYGMIVVPEPSRAMTLLLGGLVVGLRRRR